MSSISVLSHESSMRFFNSGVSFPCSSMEFTIVSLRFFSSVSLSNWSLIFPIWTSSSPPVTSFLYRLIKGIVAPSPNNPIVRSTCPTGIFKEWEMSVWNDVVIFIYFMIGTVPSWFHQRCKHPLARAADSIHDDTNIVRNSSSVCTIIIL